MITKMKKRKILAMIWCAAFSFALLAGCKNTAETGGEGQTQNAAGDGMETGGAQVDVAENKTDEPAGFSAEQLVYGNDPNNLYQLEMTPCFGDGRVYYINFNDEVASFALDGSDAKVHGTIGNISENSSGASHLNWYDGGVYYAITQYREDYTRYVEIRRMDVQTGEEAVVATCDSSDNVTDNGMIIIGENLFYSCYDPDTKATTATVFNLATQETGLILKETTAHAGLGSAVFTTDGKYLYIFIYNGLYRVYKMPLAAVYDREPSYEQVAVISLPPTVLTEKGFYTDYTDTDTHDSSFVFYHYDTSGADWSYETILDQVASDGDTGSEEGILRNLVWYSYKWFLGDGMVSVSQMNKKLYYSSSADFTQSASLGGLSFENSAVNGTGLYAGIYEGVFYLIQEDKNGVTFHTLTSDGSYK